MTVAQVVLLAVSLGYGHPQAEAIGQFAWQATHLDRTYSASSPLDPCARSWRGEGLVDATGTLRGELRRFAAQYGAPGHQSGAEAGSCVPPQVQLRFLAEAFPRHYPECAAEFDAGDTDALRRCWGEGGSR